MDSPCHRLDGVGHPLSRPPHGSRGSVRPPPRRCRHPLELEAKSHGSIRAPCRRRCAPAWLTSWLAITLLQTMLQLVGACHRSSAPPPRYRRRSVSLSCPHQKVR
uniref:Uncharacterized protein n=1 Tax=Arundo donax TaxID=35708 RepID=A0A0A8ZUK0_ARUDO